MPQAWDFKAIIADLEGSEAEAVARQLVGVAGPERTMSAEGIELVRSTFVPRFEVLTDPDSSPEDLMAAGAFLASLIGCLGQVAAQMRRHLEGLGVRVPLD